MFEEGIKVKYEPEREREREKEAEIKIGQSLGNSMGIRDLKGLGLQNLCP